MTLSLESIEVSEKQNVLFFRPDAGTGDRYPKTRHYISKCGLSFTNILPFSQRSVTDKKQRICDV
jgi:hypothetical protein